MSSAAWLQCRGTTRAGERCRVACYQSDVDAAGGVPYCRVHVSQADGGPPPAVHPAKHQDAERQAEIDAYKRRLRGDGEGGPA